MATGNPESRQREGNDQHRKPVFLNEWRERGKRQGPAPSGRARRRACAIPFSFDQSGLPEAAAQALELGIGDPACAGEGVPPDGDAPVLGRDDVDVGVSAAVSNLIIGLSFQRGSPERPCKSRVRSRQCPRRRTVYRRVKENG
jgi:hypothetical protein